MTEREEELARALAEVRARLERAAAASGRDVDEIELLPVTKFFPADDVAALTRLGCTAFAESRDQEAAAKVEEVRRLGGPGQIRWHMVGRIQRNKARSVAGWAYAAHSVDSPKVVAALDRAATEALGDGRRTEPLRVYLQLSLDGDEARGGIDVDATGRIDDLCATVDAAPGLQFVGLMAIPPLNSDAGEAFARLERERARLQGSYQQRLGLSAGMSGDLEAAVEHGSTCVRVGTALMGPRPLTSPEVVTPVTPSSQTTDSLEKPQAAPPYEGSEQ
ncbi:YggS family pyridoxal phosphate-dependent enzyme [Mycobacterium sp. 236(2023)]|uniref:YggS family pyridoxal phosphate-dependent enzyme n=1 Tax=Mycobacterium sp. 236(2023) TaxID=3038163 RepID=UPI002414EB6A|nr:YggS family pyridoxal phosphate-dependent enzyme [Mycobacterium sp. 236(2023)]MDG4666473.1 YggS family pyridoxal phosphate-dependent enzyme [Mycobacterium sp. 236(2023)]